MSNGSWKCCPYTGLPRVRLERGSDVPVTLEGFFDTSRFPGSNLFCVASIAAVCGFKDVAYFRDHVLQDPDCPIHFHKMAVVDERTGRRIGEIYATHQNSAVAGGEMWHSEQRAAAHDRALASRTTVSSIQIA
jgi:hypothetical protein